MTLRSHVVRKCTFGKLFHHTDQWTSEIDYQFENVRGKSPVDWIQNAADDAAAMYKKLIAERDTLRAENATLRAELAERNFIGAAIERNKMQPLERRGKDGRMSEIKNNEQLLVHLIVQHCDTHRLVCSSALTELQITEARKNNLFWVDEQSAIGFALVPWEFWTHKDLERASLKWAEAKP